MVLFMGLSMLTLAFSKAELFLDINNIICVKSFSASVSIIALFLFTFRVFSVLTDNEDVSCGGRPLRFALDALPNTGGG